MDIIFVSNEIASFYGYMRQIGGFNSLRIADMDVAWYDCVKKMKRELAEGKIRDIGEFNAFVKKELPDRADLVEAFCQKSIEEQEKYSAFYAKNKGAIEKYENAVKTIYSDEDRGYKKDLVKLYNFLDVDENFNCYAFYFTNNQQVLL